MIWYLTNKFVHEKQLVENILISSKLVLLHAHDFLDKQLIEKGVFEPLFVEDSLLAAVQEVVSVVRMSIKNRTLTITYNKTLLEKVPKIKFDKRRF